MKDSDRIRHVMAVNTVEEVVRVGEHAAQLRELKISTVVFHESLHTKGPVPIKMVEGGREMWGYKYTCPEEIRQCMGRLAVENIHSVSYIHPAKYYSTIGRTRAPFECWMWMRSPRLMPESYEPTQNPRVGFMDGPEISPYKEVVEGWMNRLQDHAFNCILHDSRGMIMGGRQYWWYLFNRVLVGEQAFAEGPADPILSYLTPYATILHPNTYGTAGLSWRDKDWPGNLISARFSLYVHWGDRDWMVRGMRGH